VSSLGWTFCCLARYVSAEAGVALHRRCYTLVLDWANIAAVSFPVCRPVALMMHWHSSGLRLSTLVVSNVFRSDQGVTGGLLTLVSFRQQFPSIDQYADIPQAEKDARSTYQGITVASYNLGCFCGKSPALKVTLTDKSKAPSLASSWVIP
jgi:hypothetical protein